MEKLVINCQTGKQQIIALTNAEVAVREREAALLEAKETERLVIAEIEAQKQAAIDAMLAEWQAKVNG